MPIELKWDAPDGCPSSDAVLARVRQIAGPTQAAAAQLRAEATITEPSAGEFHLRLVIRAGGLVGVRNIDGKSCQDLTGAAAVALAILLSSGESLSERELAGRPSNENHADDGHTPGTEHATQASRPAPTTPEPAPTPAESTEARPSRRYHGLLLLPLGALSVGPLRQPSLGLGFAAGASIDRWRLLAEATLWRSQHATTTNLLDEYGADLNRVSVGLRGCHAAWGSGLELAPCALVSLQHLSARGSGPNIAPQTANATWLAASVGLQARLFIVPWLSLVVGAEGELETSRPEVQLEGVGTIERLSPAAATITVGSEWIL